VHCGAGTPGAEYHPELDTEYVDGQVTDMVTAVKQLQADVDKGDLAAATSATVAVSADGTAKVLATGGTARVVTGVLTAPKGTSVAAGGSLALAGAGFTAGASLQV
ncbi:hypothetical protein IAE22_33460, partial [Bacillus sp. S34]|nr:hypothetical protein [Bacillus sp. S34]